MENAQLTQDILFKMLGRYVCYKAMEVCFFNHRHLKIFLK